MVWRDQFAYPSAADGELDCFYLLVIVNSAAVDLVHKYLYESLLSTLLGYDSGF